MDMLHKHSSQDRILTNEKAPSARQIIVTIESYRNEGQALKTAHRPFIEHRNRPPDLYFKHYSGPDDCA